MKLLLLMAVIWAIASARPEHYRENEDFQFARSSTDEGSKSGYYGAQRGNMGGNYEKAHNMDGLAQHQMSGLVTQVDGELGEGHNTRTGDVYAAANSRGMYGSGKYDLSNLQGRNFGEGTHVGNSQSHSSLSSLSSGYSGHSSSHSSGYSSSQSQDSGYSGNRRSDSSSHGLQSGNLQSSENGYREGTYGVSEQSGYNSGQHTQSSLQGHGSYGNSNTNQYSSSVNPQNRLTWTVPVRIVGRPGSRVAIPVGVQSYDATHSATSIDQNAINSEAEALDNSDHRIKYQPSNSARRYESSYNYRKQWERHDTKPEVVVLSVPTENDLPKNSELHEDVASSQSQNHFQASNSHRSNDQSAFNTKSESSQSRHQTGYNSQYAGSTGVNSNSYTQGAQSTGSGYGGNLVDNANSKPKSYHSSYSYHKSWERQGDPYEIKPAGESTAGQESQRLTSANNQGFASHSHGNQQYNSHESHYQSSADCDEDGHRRVARSVEQSQMKTENLEDLGQQTQDLSQGFSRYNDNWRQTSQQQSQDLGQLTQNSWGQGSNKLDDLGEQSQDLGQQTQNNWGQGFDKIENVSQQNQDLGQQSQNSWGQGFEKLEDLGQENQDLGQQSQNSWGQGFDKLEDVGQQNQDLGQQSQNSWGQGFEKLEDLGQENQDLGQQSQNSWGQGFDKLENVGQQNQDLGQQSQNTWGQGFEKLEDLGQQNQDLGQQTRNSWGEGFHKRNDLSQWNDLENLGQQNNKNKGVNDDVDLEPPPLRDTGPVIQAWIPVEHQHKSQLTFPTVTNIEVPIFDIYITVNPNMNKYTKYNDETFESSTINSDMTIDEYLNQQNKVAWDTENIAHNIMNNKPFKPGPVQFIKGSDEKYGKKKFTIRRGHVKPLPSSHLQRFKQSKDKGKHHQPNRYTLQQTQKNHHDLISRGYHKHIWRGQNTSPNSSYNSNNMLRDKTKARKQTTAPKNSFLRDYPSLNNQQHSRHDLQYSTYNTIHFKLQNGEMQPKVSFNNFPINTHQISSPVHALQVHKSIIGDKNIHRPNLRNMTYPKVHKQKAEVIKQVEEIEDQPEVYPNLIKIKTQPRTFKQKKHKTLENVFVEQKNVDDLIEQRNDLSQEIYEQNFLHLGKERNTAHIHPNNKEIIENKESKEESEEIPMPWNQSPNYGKASQWHNNIEDLNMSVQKLKNHKQAVKEFVYANTGLVNINNDNIEPKTNTQNIHTTTKILRNKTNIVPLELRAGDTSAIELAYLNEIQPKTTQPPPSPKPGPGPPSPLWSAMESYYNFAKDIIVDWFN